MVFHLALIARLGLTEDLDGVGVFGREHIVTRVLALQLILREMKIRLRFESAL